MRCRAKALPIIAVRALFEENNEVVVVEEQVLAAAAAAVAAAVAAAAAVVAVDEEDEEEDDDGIASGVAALLAAVLGAVWPKVDRFMSAAKAFRGATAPVEAAAGASGASASVVTTLLFFARGVEHKAQARNSCSDISS
jgi:hypothetical protein